MNTTPFPVAPHHTAIALAYKPKGLIADAVLPRISSINKKEFTYNKYNLADGLTVPDTKVGRVSPPNQVAWGATQISALCEDFGLSEPVPQDDIDQARANGQDVEGRTVEMLTDLVLLDREVRVAKSASDPANFAHNYTLSGADKFSSDDSKPIRLLSEILEEPIVRPNVIAMGAKTWARLKLHPAVVGAVYPSGNSNGVVTPEQFAALLDIEEVLVGRALINKAKKGQEIQIERAWGDFVACIYRNTLITATQGLTWGFTQPYKTREAGSLPDKSVGARGGVEVRVVESLAEVVCAPEVGLLIRSVL